MRENEINLLIVFEQSEKRLQTIFYFYFGTKLVISERLGVSCNVLETSQSVSVTVLGASAHKSIGRKGFVPLVRGRLPVAPARRLAAPVETAISSQNTIKQPQSNQIHEIIAFLPPLSHMFSNLS